MKRLAPWLAYGAPPALALAVGLAGLPRSFALERELVWARWSGWCALGALLLALSVTPSATLIALARGRRVDAAPLRRALGIAAAALASGHAITALWTYLHGELARVWTLPFARSGALALLVLWALWLTSYPRIVRALRLSEWKALHRLAYAAGLLAAHHLVLAPLAPRAISLVVLAAALALALVRALPSRLLRARLVPAGAPQEQGVQDAEDAGERREHDQEGELLLDDRGEHEDEHDRQVVSAGPDGQAADQGLGIGAQGRDPAGDQGDAEREAVEADGQKEGDPERKPVGEDEAEQAPGGREHDAGQHAPDDPDAGAPRDAGRRSAEP